MTLVSFNKILNHYFCVLQMGHKAVCPVCCVIHVKEHRALRKENGVCPGVPVLIGCILRQSSYIVLSKSIGLNTEHFDMRLGG